MNIAFRSVIWSALERFATQGMSFILTIILAKLIAPSEFGQIAMLAVFITIAQSFIDSGFSQALIQKKSPNDIDYSTVFYFNLVVSILIYLILYCCSPLIAEFYNMPSLTLVCRILGVDVILNAFAIVQRTRLTIAMDFKKMSLISIIGTFLSGILGVYLAFNGYGIWALLTQRLGNTFFQVILYWVLTRWHPMIQFSIQSFKQLFNFGSKILIGGMITNVYNNIYPLVIGRFYNPSSVAFYTWSNSISSFPSGNISGIITKVAFPVLCQHHDEKENLNNITLLLIRLISIFTFPIMLLISIFSSNIVQILLTPEWNSAIPMLSILSISAMLLPIMQQNWLYLNARGRSDLTLKAEVIKKVFAILILIITIRLGLIAICVGTLLYSISDMITIIYYTGKVGDLNFKLQFDNIYSILRCSLIASSSTIIVRAVLGDSLFSLIIGLLIFIITYVLSILRYNTSDIKIVKQLIFK